MTVTALVVEDENRAYRAVERTLISLGHEHHRVTNQEDAREKVNANVYTYVLLDLRIPATPRHSFPAIDHGFNLLNDIQTIKGPGRLPVIVTTGQSADALNIARELLASGATEIISKPFPSVGRTLSVIIREVLARVGVIGSKLGASEDMGKGDAPPLQPGAGREGKEDTPRILGPDYKPAPGEDWYGPMAMEQFAKRLELDPRTAKDELATTGLWRVGRQKWKVLLDKLPPTKRRKLTTRPKESTE